MSHAQLMQTEFISQLRDVSSRAACLTSLAIAVGIISEGDSLPRGELRTSVVADIVQAIRWLAENMEHTASNNADIIERGAK